MKTGIKTMKIGEIVKDSLSYPRLNKKNLLILGLFLFISNCCINIRHISSNNVSVAILALIGILIGILAYGYVYKVIKSTLDNDEKVPAFNDWNNLFINSIKVFIIGLVYYLPIVVFLIISIILYPSTFNSTLHYSNSPLQYIAFTFQSLIFQHTLVVPALLVNITHINYLGVFIILYLIVSIPIMLMAIAEMVNNNGKIGTAFELREILTKIGSMGWNNFVKWYILTGIIYLFFVQLLLFTEMSPILYFFIMPLVIIPYLYVYLARSVALVYMQINNP
jgi:hypothetical protein